MNLIIIFFQGSLDNYHMQNGEWTIELSNTKLTIDAEKKTFMENEEIDLGKVTIVADERAKKSKHALGVQLKKLKKIVFD